MESQGQSVLILNVNSINQCDNDHDGSGHSDNGRSNRGDRRERAIPNDLF